jgi:hypothetical protein
MNMRIEHDGRWVMADIKHRTDVPCRITTCGAPAGKRCHSAHGPRDTPHRARVLDWQDWQGSIAPDRGGPAKRPSGHADEINRLPGSPGHPQSGEAL